jgi:hypothetical protein
MKNEIYGSGNYQDFMNDSSNHAKEGEGEGLQAGLHSEIRVSHVYGNHKRIQINAVGRIRIIPSASNDIYVEVAD